MVFLIKDEFHLPTMICDTNVLSCGLAVRRVVGTLNPFDGHFTSLRSSGKNVFLTSSNPKNVDEI